MANYIDGFVFPVSRKRLKAYKHLAEGVAKVWLEHGALAYREFVGDDLHLDGTRSFVEFASATEDEVVVFGWVEFDSRAARDAVNEKVAADPRMPALIESSNADFDATRMAFAGFKPLVNEAPR